MHAHWRWYLFWEVISLRPRVYAGPQWTILFLYKKSLCLLGRMKDAPVQMPATRWGTSPSLPAVAWRGCTDGWRGARHRGAGWWRSRMGGEEIRKEPTTWRIPRWCHGRPPEARKDLLSWVSGVSELNGVGGKKNNPLTGCNNLGRNTGISPRKQENKSTQQTNEQCDVPLRGWYDQTLAIFTFFFKVI